MKPERSILVEYLTTIQRKCKCCGYIAKTIPLSKTHYLSKHEEIIQNSWCVLCKENIFDLTLHLIKKHFLVTKSCNLCLLEFEDENEINDHLLEHFKKIVNEANQAQDTGNHFLSTLNET